METSQNPLDGKTIAVFPHDKLEKVPPSHKHLLTPEVVRILRDPLEHFTRVARETPIRSMRTWLESLVENGNWSLELSTTFEADWTEVAFNLGGASSTDLAQWAKTVARLGGHSQHSVKSPRGAAIGLPVACDLERFPEAIRKYYSLVGKVRWRAFGESGYLLAPDAHGTIAETGWDFESSSALDKTRTFHFGASENGTALVYTLDGRAGWWTHRSRRSGLELSFQEMLEWIYGELLAGRAPVASE